MPLRWHFIEEHEACRSLDADFGFPQCWPAVVSCHRNAGCIQLLPPCTGIDPDTGLCDTCEGPVMALPRCKSLDQWPMGGEVNPRGLHG